jgi:hypothetical protein
MNSFFTNEIKCYNYVGSEEIKLAVASFPRGTVVHSISDLKKWINTYDKKAINFNLVVATFVINLNGDLLLADRHSEHVACAGGEPVLSAGEIFITWDKDKFEISDVTNQSTGYCPEIESWQYVEAALNKISIDHPSSFTTKFSFRRCSYCCQVNIIKNGSFICLVCNSTLPDEWNLASPCQNGKIVRQG